MHQLQSPQAIVLPAIMIIALTGIIWMSGKFMRVQIAGSTNPLLSPNFDSQLSQNLYVVNDSTGKSKTAMNKIPGYSQSKTLDAIYGTRYTKQNVYS